MLAAEFGKFRALIKIIAEQVDPKTFQEAQNTRPIFPVPTTPTVFPWRSKPSNPSIEKLPSRTRFGDYQSFFGVARIAICRRCRYSLRGIATAPNWTKCGVVH
jgi:hypothetical protein